MLEHHPKRPLPELRKSRRSASTALTRLHLLRTGADSARTETPIAAATNGCVFSASKAADYTAAAERSPPGTTASFDRTQTSQPTQQGWRVEETNLEEMVPSCLRAPDA